MGRKVSGKANIRKSKIKQSKQKKPDKYKYSIKDDRSKQISKQGKKQTSEKVTSKRASEGKKIIKRPQKRITPSPGVSRGPHPPSPSEKSILKLISKLPKYGYVSLNSTGYVYLDLNDDWIYSLEDQLSKYGFDVPPYFYGTEPTGAHITIVPSSFSKRFKNEDVPVGKKVKFQVVKAKAFFPKNWKNCWYGTEAVYFVWVKSKDLLSIARKLAGPKYNPSYGMFHINVGVRTLKKRDEMLSKKSD